MRELLILMAHGLVSTGFMLGAGWIGPDVIPRYADEVALGYAAVQAIVAVAIAATARPGSRLGAAILAVLVMLWGLLCSFMAAMSLSGSWL